MVVGLKNHRYNVKCNLIATLLLASNFSGSLAARRMTLAEFQAVQSSSYDDLSHADAHALYEADQEAAKSRRLQGGTSSNYVLCNANPSLKGKQRIDEIQTMLPGIRFRRLGNDSAHTCITIGSGVDLTVFDATDYFAYTEVTAALKKRANSATRLTKLFERADKDKYIGVELCPGVLETHGITLGELSELVKSNTQTKMPNKCEVMFTETEVIRLSDDTFMFHLGKGIAGNQHSSSNKVCVDEFFDMLTDSSNVCSIEPLQPPEIQNSYAQWIVQSNVENSLPFFDVSIDGSGQVVQVSDSGLDVDNCYFQDSITTQLFDGTVQSSNRKVVQYYNYMDTADETSGHGTHVVGTLVGRKSTDGTISGEVDGTGDGVARGAKVAFFDVGKGSDCCYIPNTSTLLDMGVTAGAFISSASWGTTDNSYTTWVASYDEYLYNNQNVLFVAAAGNSGSSGSNSVGSPGVAKNVLAVGASESSGTDLSAGMLGKDYLAYNSSRGPTEDGRTKPDLVAPGYALLSAGAQPGTNGECDESLISKSGTSMATPVVSGAAAMVRQYFVQGFYPTGSATPSNAHLPRASTIKAVLMNGAQSLLGIDLNNGSSATIATYDNNQGNGLVSLSNSLYLGDVSSAKLYAHEDSLFQDDVWSKTFSIGSCNVGDFSVTLAYTDMASSSGCTSCLMNDLDLIVTKASVVYYPNGGTSADSTNSIERTIISATNGDSITVSVTATNLMSEQSFFSVVATGCFDVDTALESAPTQAPTKTPTLIPTKAPTLTPTSTRIPAGINDWAIEGGGIDGNEAFTLSFNNDSSTISVPFRFTQSRNIQFSVMLKDCETPLDPIIGSVSGDIEKYYNASHNTMDAIVDLTVTEFTSDVYNSSSVDSSQGDLWLCVRADLVEPTLDLDGDGIGNDSVSYLKLQLHATIILDQDFSATIDTSVKVDALDDINESVTIAGDVQACRCDANTNNCLTEAVTQNSFVTFCIYFGSAKPADVYFDSLMSMQLDQDGLTLNTVSGGSPNSISLVYPATDTLLKVGTRIVSAFYGNTDTTVTATGVVLLKFSGGRRLVSLSNRVLQDDQLTTNQFSLQFMVDNDSYVEPSASVNTYPGVTASILIATIASTIAAI